MESGRIIVQNEIGEDIACDVLFTFDNDETNKSYIVYTDNNKDELGNIKVYANTYSKNKENGNLGEIKTEEEWKIIEQIFSSIVNKSEVENG